MLDIWERHLFYRLNNTNQIPISVKYIYEREVIECIAYIKMSLLQTARHTPKDKLYD